MGVFGRLRDDWIFLSNYLRVMRRLRKILESPDATFSDRIATQAAAYPGREAIFFEDEVVTYGQYNARADAVAHWLKGEGLKKGESVALMMENSADYLVNWLGIIRAGGVAALINTHLTSNPLAHCLNISGARHLILGSNLADQYAGAADSLDREMRVWASGGLIQGAEDLDAALAAQPQTPFHLSGEDRPTIKDEALYIYTSGTTGNPKAARISHYRLLGMMTGFVSALLPKGGDRVYIVLPLYHSAGGVCAVGTGLLTGAAVIIRRRFSAKAFWDDVDRYGATLFQYIGELCRYLLNAPPHPKERSHKLRAITGNGMRPEIWGKFAERFAIPKVLEFYGATEGNVSLLNWDGKESAVGRIPLWAHKRAPMALVRFDMEAEEPMRNAEGFCIRCGPGQTGEALGHIMQDDPKNPGARFEGYVGKKETQSKILRDVFEKGDEWFRTGDLLRFDDRGYFHFIDRIGDTFRWKGENVATSEVSEAVSVFPGVEEANVYGVSVPGADGRAGMVSLTGSDSLDLKAFHAHVSEHLPVYAQPLFVRLQKAIEITGTFKHRKVDLVKEGFDPRRIEDPIYFNDSSSGAYVRLDGDLFDKIVSGGVRI